MLNKLEILILSTIQTIYDAWGWFGVAALLAFENATGITPSEIILGLAGWMLISEHQLHPSMIFLGGFYAALGSTIGASITYWVARLGGRPLVDRMTHWVRIDARHFIRAEAQFHRWGTGLVLVGRLMPGIRTLVSIPAGLARMSFLTFFVATFIGAYVWCTILIGAGYLLGHEWPLISGYLKKALPYLLIGGCVALVLYFWFFKSNSILAFFKIKDKKLESLTFNSGQKEFSMSKPSTHHTRSPLAKRLWKPAALTGAGGAAIVLWFEEIIAFGVEILSLAFLSIMAGIIYLLDIFMFKSRLPGHKDLDNSANNSTKRGDKQ